MVLLTIIKHSLTIFLILRVIYGVAMGGVWGVASSLAMETIPDRSREFMSGVFRRASDRDFCAGGIR